MLLISICILFIGGCEAPKDNFEYAVEVEEISLGVQAVTRDYSGMRGNLGLYEDKLLYAEYSETNRTEEMFYILDFKKGVIQKVGTIEGVVMGGGSKVLLNDILYFHMCTHDDGKLANVLYALDLSNNEITPIYQNYYTKKLPPLINVANNLYAWQGNETDSTYDSFLEKIDEAGTSIRVTLKPNDIISSKADSDIYGILYVDSDRENMYALEKIISEQDIKHYITKYTSDFACVHICDISSVFTDYAITDSISRFYTFGDYFFLSDYSDKSIIGRCNGDEAEVLLCEKNLAYAVNSKKNDGNEIFYIRRTNDIYQLNLQSGNLEELDYDFDNDNSVIRNIFVCDNKVIIAKMVGEKEILYLISQE
jgi:hypothetical protein